MVVDVGPLFPRCEGFVFPDIERIEVNYCGLDYFLIHEDSPGDCIHVISLYVRKHVSFLVDCLVRDHFKLLQMIDQFGQ